MLSFQEYLTEKKKGNLKDACWDGYEAIGMKNKGGKKVPNCVPVKEGLADDFLKMAHGMGYKNARIVTPEQKKKETEELLKKRAEERKKNPPKPVQMAPRKTGFGSGAEDDTKGT